MKAATLIIATLGCVTIACKTRVPEYELEQVVPGSPFLGIHGLTFDHEDRIWVGSILSQAIYRVDPASGDVQQMIGSPEGMADDLEFGPDGTPAEGLLAWTGAGGVGGRLPDGTLVRLGETGGANPVAFDSRGRLFVGQFSQAKPGLFEIDPRGVDPPRRIMELSAGINGFDFGPDGRLYGPLPSEGQIVRIDVDAATQEIVADGFGFPGAANFDSQGNLYVTDVARGELVLVDVDSGERDVVVRVEPGIDNLAIDSSDHVFLTLINNTIYEVSPDTGHVREVIRTNLTAPSDLAVASDGGREFVYVADTFALRRVDISSGAVDDLGWAPTIEFPAMLDVHDDQIVVSPWRGRGVQILDRRDGTVVRTIGTRFFDSFGVPVQPSDFNRPRDVLLLDDGDLIVAEAGENRLVLVPADRPAAREPFKFELQEPFGLARSGDDVYVTERSGGRISRIDLAAGTHAMLVSGLSEPEGLAVDNDGMLVVAETGARRIVRIDPGSGAIVVIARNLPIGVNPAVPTGVAVSESGAVFFGSDEDGALYRLVPR